MLCAGEACVALFPRCGDERAGDTGGGFRHVAFRRTDRAGFESSRNALERHGVELQFEGPRHLPLALPEHPDGYQMEIRTYDVPAQ